MKIPGLKKPTIKLRNRPLGFIERLESLAQTGRLGRMPPWVAAMRAAPPAPAPLRTVVPSETGQFVPAGARERTHTLQMTRAYTRSNRNRPILVKTAPAIVYDEDEIRAVFYRRHPFELARGRAIAEDEALLGTVVWSDIFGGSANVPLSGESVIQRTLHLMQAEKQTRATAYANALSEFYAARAEQERKAIAALKLAEEEAQRQNDLLEATIDPATGNTGGATTASAIDPWTKSHPLTAKFMRLEQDQLAESNLHHKRAMEALVERKALKDKMSAFEVRNLEKPADK